FDLVKRLCEQVALCRMASKGAKQLELLFVLNAFRDDVQSQLHGHLGQRADDGGAVLACFDTAYKGSVDLQRVDRELPKMRERRIAGSEVVDADADAGRAELHQQTLHTG